MRLEIAPDLAIDDSELTISFIQSGGPGGQNVNKLATAAQLRFDALHSSSLSDDIKARLRKLAGTRLTRDGVIVMTARQYRTQERNRQDAVARLLDLIRRASLRPVRRRPTKPSAGEREKRLAAKTHRAAIKKGRGRPGGDE